MKEWGKSEGARNFSATRIKAYINAPIIDNFDNSKEEPAKFLVRRYHNEKIWLDEPIAITDNLINFITSIPLSGEPIPVGSKNLALLEWLTRLNKKCKNSKGLQINSIESLTIKWTTLIISICLTISYRPFDVKLDILEDIEGVPPMEKLKVGLTT